MESLIIIGVVLLAVVFVVILYNRLVRLRNAYRSSYSQIDVQLKRRHDLIPNLVETVKGYAAHERETFEAVTQARNQAETARTSVSGVDDAEGLGRLQRAEGQLGGVLGRLFALSEAYPDLKANQNFLDLQEQLVSTENLVSFSRQAYNDAVERYNNAVGSVPSNFVAGTFGFKEATLLEFEDREAIQAAPTVSFG